MSKYQVHVHWREPVDGESSSVFRNCELVDDNQTVLAISQGKRKHFITLAATQLITTTPEKETA